MTQLEGKTGQQSGTEQQGYIGDWDELLERLKEVCREKKISLHKKDSHYRHPVLYWPDLRTVIVFANASIPNIHCMLNYLH